jgi:hypothetical protein
MVTEVLAKHGCLEKQDGVYSTRKRGGDRVFRVYKIDPNLLNG